MLGRDFEDSLNEELKNPDMAIAFIQDALENPADDGDELGYLIKAIKKVARAHKASDLITSSGLAKATVYNILKEDSNPTFSNVMKIMKAIGLTFSVTKFEHEETAASACDVADYIMKNYQKAARETTFWLQKIIYYSQVKHLVDFRIALFHQPIEAWKNGPVVRELYSQHQGAMYLSPTMSFGGDAKNLSVRQKQSIDCTLDKYGSASGEVLSELTHREDPWRNARGSVPEGGYSTSHITHESILDYYPKQTVFSDDDSFE